MGSFLRLPVEIWTDKIWTFKMWNACPNAYKRQLNYHLNYSHTYKVKTQKTMYIKVLFFVSKGEGRELAYF